jgi:hypothetical protein
MNSIHLPTRSRLALGLTACLFSLLASNAFATPISLVPGNAYFAPAGSGPIGGTVELGTGLPVPFVSATFNGTLISTVYSGDSTNPYGGLTFTYQLINNALPSPAGDIDRLTINSYAGFSVNGSYQSPSGNVLPTLVDRDLAGDVVGFSFLNLPGGLGNGPLHKGFTSALLVLQTNATAYQSTMAAVIDGSTVNVPTFGPMANIPEPGSFVLAAIGLVALAGWSWRRRGV